MKQMVGHRDAPYLPEEIIRDILKRLPLKSLIRFHCVCKHWRNLLKTPSFAVDHLRHCSLQNPYLLLEQSSGFKSLNLRLMDAEMRVREVQSPPLLGSSQELRIIGSSYGLLCVAIDEYDISTSSLFLCNSLLLWNPVIGGVRQIPRTRTVKLGDWNCTVGFGFSAVVNDYKVVKTYAEYDDVVSGVEVYSLSKGSWKEIEFGSLEGVRLFGDTAATNGAIFWNGERRRVEEEDMDLIVSFDIAMEAFTLIPQPPVPDNSFSKLTVYEDKFAILSLYTIGDFLNSRHSLIDLWVLEEGMGSSTERWSWTKKYTSNPCSSTLHLGTIWKNEIVYIDLEMPSVTNESGHETETGEQIVGLSLINISTNESNVIAIPGRGCLYDVFSHIHFGEP